VDRGEYSKQKAVHADGAKRESYDPITHDPTSRTPTLWDGQGCHEHRQKSAQCDTRPMPAMFVDVRDEREETGTAHQPKE
jgi:hypothetical protein